MNTHGPYRSLLPFTRILTGIFLVNALHNLITAYYDLRLLDLVRGMHHGDPGAIDEVTGMSGDIETLMYAGGVLVLVMSIGFLVWAYRANRNARALGAGHMENTPGWTVGWFFVPFLSLWKPYQAIKEIWLASNPDVDLEAESESGREWMLPSYKAPGFLLAWWLVWLTDNMIIQYGTFASGDASSLAGQTSALRIELLSCGVELVATGLVLAVMWSIVKRQEARAERRLLPSASIRT